MTYAVALDLYLAKGWPEVLPLPPGRKTPPPSGFTGARHADVVPSAQDYATWRTANADGNVALRMPSHIVGIDVDAYAGKPGAESLAIAEEAWGRLPATWRVTSRDDDISGIRFFRVPAGLAWPSIVGPGIEMVHRGHRYAVVWPSLHPDTGRRYEWRLDGSRAPVEPPEAAALPFLPESWIEGLTGGQEAVVTPRAGADLATMATAIDHWQTTGAPCRQVLIKVAEVNHALRHGQAGSRHDIVRDRLLKVIRLGQTGHAGVGWAMDYIGELFVDTLGPERGARVAEQEWESLVRGGVDVILADLKPVEPCYGDRCELGTIPSLDHLPVVQPILVDPVTGDASTAEEVSIYADLSWLLTGELPEIRPAEVLRRGEEFDGHALFYRGKVNGVFGEPETAKTWLALLAVVTELDAGGKVVFVDVDHNGSVELAQRLIQLGAPPGVVADPTRFLVAEPSIPQDCSLLVSDMKIWQPTLVVIDSLGEVLPMLNASSKDNDEITRALRFLVKPMAHQIGACVILLDHVAKDGGDSGYAIGGTAKKRAMDGAYYKAMVRGVKVPAPGRVGEITLVVEKDRAGQVRRHAVGKTIGVFTIDSTDVTGRIRAWIGEPPSKTAAEVQPQDLVDNPSAMTAEDRELCQRITSLAIFGVTQNQLVEQLGVHKRRVQRVLPYLRENGYVEVDKTSPRRHIVKTRNPYDPLVERVREGLNPGVGPVGPELGQSWASGPTSKAGGLGHREGVGPIGPTPGVAQPQLPAQDNAESPALGQGGGPTGAGPKRKKVR